MAKTNRYKGNSGNVTKYRPQQPNVRTGQLPSPPQKQEFRQQEPRQCVRAAAKREKTDMQDIWVLAVFFLLYLESRDTDFLIILAVLAFSIFDMGDLKGLLGGILGV